MRTELPSNTPSSNLGLIVREIPEGEGKERQDGKGGQGKERPEGKGREAAQEKGGAED